MLRWNLRAGDEIAADLHAVRLLDATAGYETYVAWHGGLCTLVAAKLVRPGQVADGGWLDGLRREASMLHRLAHPLLPRVFGAALSGHRPHLVLELPRGPRLARRIRAGGVSAERLLPMALDLCATLQYLARQDVVHLAVQPRNVCVGAQLRLLDFSRARRTAEPAPRETPAGGEAHLAPEQCDVHRFGEIGSASDIWGLGATLHEALSGRHPFPDDGARFPQLRAAPRQLPNHVPGHMAAAIRASLATRPADRPTARELAEALVPLASEPPGAVRRFSPSPTRHNTLQEVQ